MKAVEGKVIISVDHESKNSYTFEGGLKIDWKETGTISIKERRIQLMLL